MQRVQAAALLRQVSALRLAQPVPEAQLEARRLEVRQLLAQAYPDPEA
jgi:hypothetical protein